MIPLALAVWLVASVIVALVVGGAIGQQRQGR